jgi:hypothetical protein
MLCLITVYASFVYPEYPLTATDPGNEGVDEYRECDHEHTDFYTKNGYDREDLTLTQSFNMIEGSPLEVLLGSPQNLTCLQALDFYASIDPGNNPYPPPNDSPFCCLALRYTTDQDIEVTVSTNHDPVVLNIEAEYGLANSAEFVTLCEELWACTSYVDQYSENQCEANQANLNRGCEEYVARSLCFNEAYNPSSEEEIKQRRAFIVETCKFR